ncbi:hypothetical protein ACJMK2_009861 [Sinanodonta woodiana]
MKMLSLVCPENTHDPIPLPHGVPVIIGRSPLTRIIDKRCSRQQLELTADCTLGEVTVKQLGSNSSALDGIELMQGRQYQMRQNSTLYVLTGYYPQKFHVQEDHSEKVGLEEKFIVPLVNSNRKDKLEEKFKIPKISENSNKTDLVSNARKRPSSVKSEDVETPSKKTKSSMEKKQTAEANDSDDGENVKNIAEKLQKMKEMSKKNKCLSPHANTPSDSVPSSSLTKTSTNAGAPVKESVWEKYDKLYVYRREGLQAKEKIAGFDIDGTIITTKSGKVFPVDNDDWRLWTGEIPKKLKKLNEDGYKVVFFTNQLGVARGKTKIEDLQSKFTMIVERIGVPIQILVSTSGGIYRKPATGMWDYLVQKGNDGMPIDISKSFYVGDAAGRPEKWAPKKKKDFSSSDRLFALNIGLQFFTPEEYFFGQKKAPFDTPEFDPRTCKPTDPLLSPANAKLASNSQEVIVLVGCPASGKSFFAKTHLVPKGYVHVSRDTLGSWQKCVKLCMEALQTGKSVVVDNTNPDPESRGRYIECAKKAKVQCRCFVSTVGHMQSRHNERFREIVDKSHQPINEMIMNSHKKQYKPPELKEGFSEIVKVNFVPHFSNPDHQTLYCQFLLEK